MPFPFNCLHVIHCTFLHCKTQDLLSETRQVKRLFLARLYHH